MVWGYIFHWNKKLQDEVTIGFDANELYTSRGSYVNYSKSRRTVWQNLFTLAQRCYCYI